MHALDYSEHKPCVSSPAWYWWGCSDLQEPPAHPSNRLLLFVVAAARVQRAWRSSWKALGCPSSCFWCQVPGSQPLPQVGKEITRKSPSCAAGGTQDMIATVSGKEEAPPL